jgi:hypothetical protein
MFDTTVGGWTGRCDVVIRIIVAISWTMEESMQVELERNTVAFP